jgi:hypothetical protein
MLPGAREVKLMVRCREGARRGVRMIETRKMRRVVSRFTLDLTYFYHIAFVGYDPMHTLAGVVKDVVKLVLTGDR